MKKAATGGQFRELIGKLLTKIGDEKIALIENQQIQNAIDQPDQTANKFIDWINNGCKISNQNNYANPKNLAFVKDIILGDVMEFVVGDRFQQRAKNKVGIQLYFGDNFVNWILNPMKNKSVTLASGLKLKKFSLVKPMFDTEIQSELQNPKSIDVKIFFPLIWEMMLLQKNGEAKENGLLNNGCSNIFHVKLEDDRVVAVRVDWRDNGWSLVAYVLNCDYRWSDGDVFFTLATA